MKPESPALRPPTHRIHPPRWLRLLLTALLAAAAALGAWRWAGEARLHRAGVPELTAITAREPDNAAAHYYLGRARRQAGQHAAAIEAFRKALAADPRDLRSRKALVLSLLTLGRDDEAGPELDPIRAEAPESGVVHVALGQFAAHAGDAAAAIEEFRRATAVDPREAEGWYRLGLTLGQSHQFTEARRALDHALELEPGNADILTARGFCDLDSGRTAEAIPWLRQAVSVSPGHPEANRYLGEALYLQPGPPAQMEEARACLRRAVRSAPDFSDAWFWLARAALRLGATDEAIRSLQQVLNQKPDNEAALQLLGQTCLRTGKRQEGERLLARFRKAAEFDVAMISLQKRAVAEPARADLRLRMARLLAGRGQWAAAAGQYEQAVRLDPRDETARRELDAARAKAAAVSRK